MVNREKRMILGIHHINLVVTDILESINFFEILGFSVFEEKELSGKWIDTVTGLRDALQFQEQTVSESGT